MYIYISSKHLGAFGMWLFFFVNNLSLIYLKETKQKDFRKNINLCGKTGFIKVKQAEAF